MNRQLGPYRIVRKIGEGGMGIVYEAIHEDIERRVAVKLLRESFAAQPLVSSRFLNEARAVNRIAHPGIVQVNDVGKTPEGELYIIMEFLDGETLSRRRERLGGKLPFPMILYLSAQIASALAVAHAKGIVHRDLKPDNVIIVDDPVAPGGERTKLLDFGIAKIVTTAAVPNGATSTGVVMGTPNYMAPEQCRDSGQVDDKADVYALGVMLFLFAAGQLPFIGVGAEVLGMHLFKPPPSLAQFAPNAPPGFIALVDRLLVKEKAVRPAMTEVRDELEGLLSQYGPAAASGPTLLPVAFLMQPRPRAWSIALSAALALALGTGIHQWLQHRTPPAVSVAPRTAAAPPAKPAALPVTSTTVSVQVPVPPAPNVLPPVPVEPTAVGTPSGKPPRPKPFTDRPRRPPATPATHIAADGTVTKAGKVYED